jgi:hypothetical protein
MHPQFQTLDPSLVVMLCTKTSLRSLANQLTSVLPMVVDKAQVAFVKRRCIVDNILLAQELILQYKRKRVSPRCMLKIDLRKAYDTISWNFLHSVLGGLGFPPICVSSTSFSTQINGDLFNFFKGKRGLRQGDPISLFLFVLCMEYFSQ